MAAERKDPFRNFRFRLEIEGIHEAAFSECTIPDSTSDVIDYREGADERWARKLPGLTKWANITLKRGLTMSPALSDWRTLVERGAMKQARRDVAIVILDEEKDDGARWEFSNAWPAKYDGPDLNAKGNDVAIETLELAHEGMKRTK